MTLDEAIKGAEAGSIIYMPGGGFVVTDSAKINKKLTIMGVSHRGDTDNVDGATIISGNLNFVGGSSGSAVIGAYVNGNVNVGEKDNAVTNFTMRYCFVNSVQVGNSGCSGMDINQCFIKNASNYGGCNVHITNCIFPYLREINGGVIDHNIITSNTTFGTGNYRTLYNVSSTTITNNVLLDSWNVIQNGEGCFISHNSIGAKSWGDNSIVLPEGKKFNDVFVSNKGVSFTSDYNLSTAWGKGAALDGTDIGVSGGTTGFKNKGAVAPIPRIVSKKVAESTDGSGKLLIEVTVKAQ
jgi:hypothetical protein